MEWKRSAGAPSSPHSGNEAEGSGSGDLSPESHSEGERLPRAKHMSLL